MPFLLEKLRALRIFPPTRGRPGSKCGLIARNFRIAQDGSVAVIMALALLPLLVMVGSTIDYARAAAAQEKLQSATDAATLNRTQDAKNGVSMSTIGTKLRAEVIAQTGDQNVTLPNDPTFSSTTMTMCSETRSVSRNVFLGILRLQSIPIAGHSCSSFNMDSFEIAIVVDNSGSMGNSALNGQTKMQAAIQAANNLVSTLTATPVAAPRTAFSVVPFSSSVNVGNSNQSKPFIDSAGKSSIHFKSFQRPAGAPWLPTSKFDLITGVGSGWYGCVEERPAPYMTSDTAANSATSYDTLYVPFMYPDENDSNPGSIADYIDDGGGSCNGNDTYYLADRNNTALRDGQSKVCKYKGGSKKIGNTLFGEGFPLGPNVTCTSKALTPLTTQTTTVTNAINAMAPIGDTNIMSGIMWGWRTISPNGPFNADASTNPVGPQIAKSYGYVNTSGGKNHKTIVLLTDGDNHWGGQSGDPAAYGYDNNKSAYNAFGFFAENRIGGSANPTTASNAYTQLNSITLEACTNAKNAGVEIYTVGFTATDGISTAGQNLLTNCSSGVGYNFIAADGNALISVFQTIANSMTALRLSF